MTITRVLENPNLCEIDTVITREDKNDYRESRYSFYQNAFPNQLSGKAVLEKTSEEGHYDYELDGKKVEGEVVKLMYRDTSNTMPHLFLTFNEFVEQGKPLLFQRKPLKYEPVKRKK